MRPESRLVATRYHCCLGGTALEDAAQAKSEKEI